MVKNLIKRIGVLTSGGDSPGMNAAVRAVVRCAVYNGLEVVGIEKGYVGLVENKVFPMDNRSVSNIINRGGTILKTARCPEFETLKGRRKAKQNVEVNHIDGIVVIGGDGSYRGAHVFSTKEKVPCIGIPGTIDNDINGTDATIGSDTATNTALEAIDKIRDTATSLERIFVVEVMGRSSGYIAMQVALSGGAEEVIVPEMRYDIDAMCREIEMGRRRGKVSWIIIVAEGAASGTVLAEKISKKTGYETRATVLGHIQRGGIPTARDRILATRLGASAVDLLLKGDTDKAIGVENEKIKVVPLKYAVRKKNGVDRDLYNLMRILAT